MSDKVEKIMVIVRDYDERETVENDLETVLKLVKAADPILFTTIANFITDVESKDVFIETDPTWESLKEGDEVLLTECYVNKDKKPIRMVVVNIVEDMVALRECGRWVAVPWMTREVFEKRIITHWTKNE